MVKKKSNVWKHWTILARNLTENQDDQTEEQIEDQVENQTETQAKDQIEDDKPHPRVKCKYCPKIFERGIATRMQAHLDATCSGAPSNAKSKSKIQRNISSTIKASTSVPSSNASRVQKRLKTIPISNFADSMSDNEQESLEFELAQALFATGTSFSFLENPYVIKFFQHIRPIFKLPNRKKLSNELLNKVYDEVNIESNIQISQARSLSMISDGWSNINQESVQNFIVCTPKPFFLRQFIQEKHHIQQNGFQIK